MLAGKSALGQLRFQAYVCFGVVSLLTLLVPIATTRFPQKANVKLIVSDIAQLYSIALCEDGCACTALRATGALHHGDASLRLALRQRWGHKKGHMCLQKSSCAELLSWSPHARAPFNTQSTP